MFAPQYSLRRLLAIVTASAFVCLVVMAGARGHVWAAAIVIALVGLVLTLLLHAVAFILLRGGSLWIERSRARRAARLGTAQAPSSP